MKLTIPKMMNPVDNPADTPKIFVKVNIFADKPIKNNTVPNNPKIVIGL